MRQFVNMACATYILNGLATVILGALLPLILHHYDVSYTVGGRLVFLQFTGFLTGVPLSSFVVRRLKPRLTLAVSSFFTGIAAIGIGSLPSLPVVAVLCFINGASLASFEATIATAIMEYFAGRRAVVMSRLEVAFGMGAVLMPLIAAWLIATGRWIDSFWLVGTCSLMVTLLWIILPIRLEPDTSRGPQDAETAAPVFMRTGAKAFLLTAFLLMIFLYVGIEACLNSFLPSIFISNYGVGESSASLTVTVFWIAMVIGRALTGWVVRKVVYARFLSVSIIAALILLAVLAVWRSVVVAYALVFLVGLAMSGIFVVTMVFANHTFPNQEQKITRLVTAFAGIGGAVLPGIFGWLMDHFSITDNLWSIAGFTLVLLVIHLSIVGMQSSARRHASNCAAV